MFSTQLKSIRKAKKMSQKQVADYLGVGQTTIANYEKGIRLPNQVILRELARLFNTSVDLLIGEDTSQGQVYFDTSELQEIYKDYFNHLMTGNEVQAVTLIESLATSKQKIIQLIEQVIVTTLYEVGKGWSEGLVDVAREHYMTEVSRKIITSIGSKLATGVAMKNTAMCLTYYGESHHLGLLIVAEYLKALGFNTFYIGGNTPTDAIVKMIHEVQPDLIALSVTLESHLQGNSELIQIIKDNDPLNRIKIIVGGQGLSEKHNLNIDGVANDFRGLENLISLWG